MIYGIGCDLLDTQRFVKAAQESLLRRCFSARELECFADSPRRLQQLAGNFAAKEALAKALGCGIFAFALSEVSVLRDSRGAPYYEFDGGFLQRMSGRELTAKVSLSNTAAQVMAFTILEEKE